MLWGVVRRVVFEETAFELRPERGMGISWTKRRKSMCLVLRQEAAACIQARRGEARRPSVVSREEPGCRGWGGPEHVALKTVESILHLIPGTTGSCKKVLSKEVM